MSDLDARMEAIDREAECVGKAVADPGPNPTTLEVFLAPAALQKQRADVYRRHLRAALEREAVLRQSVDAALRELGSSTRPSLWIRNALAVLTAALKSDPMTDRLDEIAAEAAGLTAGPLAGSRETLLRRLAEGNERLAALLREAIEIARREREQNYLGMMDAANFGVFLLDTLTMIP